MAGNETRRVVVWVVGDATINGSETGTSFRQALHFKELGFNLHDTMIYEKCGTGACGSNYAYWQIFEYMFVFSKGKPTTVNRIADSKNVTAGTVRKSGRRAADGNQKDANIRVVPSYAVRSNVWKIQQNNKDEIARGHPAVFPEQLASDHIISWSNPGDLVFDLFSGSGTTAKMALVNGRNFIGCDISAEYVELSKARLRAHGLIM